MYHNLGTSQCYAAHPPSAYSLWSLLCSICWSLLNTCIHKEIIISWGDHIFFILIVPLILCNICYCRIAVGIDLEVSKMGNAVIRWECSSVQVRIHLPETFWWHDQRTPQIFPERAKLWLPYIECTKIIILYSPI